MTEEASLPTPEEAGDHLEARDLPGEEPLAVTPREAWRDRYDAYDPQYLGPPSWCRFLKVLAATGNVPFARQAAGIASKTLNLRRQRYPEFDEALCCALEHFNHAVLERAAAVRAVDGVDEPVWRNDGENGPVLVGYIRRYSDTLMNTMLKARIPEYNRDKHEVTGANGGPVVVHLHPSDSKL